MDALLVAKIISMICLGLLTWLVSGTRYTLHISETLTLPPRWVSCLWWECDGVG